MGGPCLHLDTLDTPCLTLWQRGRKLRKLRRSQKSQPALRVSACWTPERRALQSSGPGLPGLRTLQGLSPRGPQKRKVVEASRGGVQPEWLESGLGRGQKPGLAGGWVSLGQQETARLCEERGVGGMWGAGMGAEWGVLGSR